MKKDFRIKEKEIIYLDGEQFIPEVFDKTYKFENFIVAYNSDKLVIINCDEATVFSKRGMVTQVFNDGEYIAIRDINNYMGIIRYDFKTVVPFIYLQTVIIENGSFLVRKDSLSYLEQYNPFEK